MICDDCYHLSDCEKKPDENGRCSSYLKDSTVVIDDDMEVNPMDTLTFDYDDIKRMLEEVDKENKQKKKRKNSADIVLRGYDKGVY